MSDLEKTTSQLSEKLCDANIDYKKTCKTYSIAEHEEMHNYEKKVIRNY